GAGDQGDLGGQEFRRDEITAAPGREQLDDLVVACRDDEDGKRHEQREREREENVLPEREIGLFRPVRGRAETVRAEADPREKRDQRYLMKNPRIERILGFAEKHFLQRSSHAVVRDKRLKRRRPSSRRRGWGE